MDWGLIALPLPSTLYLSSVFKSGLFGDHNVGGMKSGVSLLSILMVYLDLWARTLSSWKIKQPSGAIFLITA